jgi:hypothetical protein
MNVVRFSYLLIFTLFQGFSSIAYSVADQQSCGTVIQNSNALTKAKEYDLTHSRTMVNMGAFLGLQFASDFNKLPDDSVILDIGGGFGLAALEATRARKIKSQVINAQDFWYELMAANSQQSIMKLNYDGTLKSIWQDKWRGISIPDIYSFSRALDQPISKMRDMRSLSDGFDKTLSSVISFYKNSIASGRFVYKVGMAEEILPTIETESVALSFETWGGHFYSPERLKILKETYRTLKIGGRAYFVIRPGIDFVEVNDKREFIERYLWLQNPGVVSVTRSEGADSNIEFKGTEGQFKWSNTNGPDPKNPRQFVLSLEKISSAPLKVNLDVDFSEVKILSMTIERSKMPATFPTNIIYRPK